MPQSKIDDLVRELALRIGAEALSVSALLPNGDKLGCNLVMLRIDSPKLRAMAFRALAKHLVYCAARAKAAAKAAEAAVH